MDNYLTLKSILGFVAVAVGLVGYYPYIRDTLKGKTKPHAYSWFIWAILTGAAFVAQIVKGGGPGAWVTGVTAAICLVIWLLALKYGHKQIISSDRWCLVGALSGVLLWLVTREPTLSVIVITLTDALAFLPTFRKSYHHPSEETLVEYVLASVKFVIGLAALSEFNLVTVLYPASLVVMNSAFVIMVLFRKSNPLKRK